MDTLRVEAKGVRMIAHRGLSGIETENTAAAFIAAANRSYFGIETDVHKTADGNYVVIHDDTTGRVAERNIPVEGTALAELRRLALIDRDGSTRIDLRIPTLQEYLSICRRYRKVGVLEFKNKFSSGEIAEILQIIREVYDLQKMLFISFSLSNLLELRRIFPQARAEYLVSEWDDQLLELLPAQRLGLDIDYRVLNRELVKRIKQKGILLNAWTCDDTADAKKLIQWGVDQITTNILE
ncbi:glycerophosphodiester phosphodiesterase family protein [Massiliimalia massiliensis]|jgi:glycerophosphoryl diester phosphodiesterase|uniref:glycerophosphodiester phosphodiesterase family protein n=1 Tax=Massiliimalia massiliensis TaxID=1852384 RepID=UPI0009873165|nr:glycerophosphodiester phosphodiesterase family protein [Massiliimalia massiliensis]